MEYTKEMKKPKVVITYGTFDMFHFGHERLLKRAKERGDYLIVGVATDEYNEQKGKAAMQSFEERLKYVESLPYVDKAIPETGIEPQWFEDYKNYDVDLIVMGDDKVGELDYLKKDMNLIYLPRTKDVSSTQIREEIKAKKVVITYGTFDYLHEGHLNILKRASDLGEILIVGVSSDNFNKIKGKPATRFTQEERINELIKLPYINHVILEESWDQKRKDFEKYSVDIFVMGSDWEGKFDKFKDQVDVVYLPRTEGISSTQLREQDEEYKK